MEKALTFTCGRRERVNVSLIARVNNFEARLLPKVDLLPAYWYLVNECLGCNAFVKHEL